MSDSTPFWQEVRRSLMVRGDAWKPVIESLPDHVTLDGIRSLFQTPDQLTYLVGQGHIAGQLVESSPSREVLLPFLQPRTALAYHHLSLENVAMQWLYRFVVIEGLIEHNRKEPLQKWPPMFLHMVEEGLRFMVYMAALLVLMEEGKLENPLPNPKIAPSEPLVKQRIKEACAFLHPKAQDYGESFRRHGLPGLLPRLWDKIARYAQLRADNRPSNFEKKEDSARDLLGYSLIAYSLMLELPEDFRRSYQPTAVYETESNVMAGAEWKKVN
jgi:hypothetical protein